jgi:predicted nucleotidyltransferase
MDPRDDARTVLEDFSFAPIRSSPKIRSPRTVSDTHGNAENPRPPDERGPNPPMNILDAAGEIAAFLEKYKIPYVILGGLAVQYHGEPRFTHDVDLMVLVPPEKTERFLDLILNTFRPRTSDAKSFAVKNRVLLIFSRDRIPIDVSFGIPGYEEDVIRRAVRYAPRKGRAFNLISAEDLIIHKCVAGRPRDLEDVENILTHKRLKIDLRYLRNWLREFGEFIDEHDVLGHFETALKKARRRLDGHRRGKK